MSEVKRNYQLAVERKKRQRDPLFQRPLPSMTAAATPNAPNRGDWAWPLKPPLPSPSPPLELQFLPPSAAAASTDSRSSSASPWTIDPSRLQKLMMGSVAAPASSSPAIVPSISIRGSHVPDFGASFDAGVNKSLPSGWERCLDLKSGEVFIKKCDVNRRGAGLSPEQLRHHSTPSHEWKQARVRPSRGSVGVVQIDESLRWMQGSEPAIPIQKLMSNSTSYVNTDARLEEDERPTSPDGQPLCLDLDLRLTSDNRSRCVGGASDMACFRSSKSVSSTHGSNDVSSQSKVQPWKWQQIAHSFESPHPASIQEMVRESTMVTAVCSKCLMYVLLKKSNPTCPRCFNPIILDCGVRPLPAGNKRPRLELSPDDLSLSTDSSR